MTATRRAFASGIWWTDPIALRRRIRSIKARRGEDKRAAYFEPGAFNPWNRFSDELAARRYERSAELIGTDAFAFLE